MTFTPETDKSNTTERIEQEASRERENSLEDWCMVCARRRGGVNEEPAITRSNTRRYFAAQRREKKQLQQPSTEDQEHELSASCNSNYGGGGGGVPSHARTTPRAGLVKRRGSLFGTLFVSRLETTMNAERKKERKRKHAQSKRTKQLRNGTEPK